MKVAQFDASYTRKLGDTTLAQGGGVSVDTGNSGSVGGSGAPTGGAGGDLGGSYPGPTVVGIQGTPVDALPADATEYLDGTGHWTTPAGGGGGGGLAQTYLGTNSVGGSIDALTTTRIRILKQIVLPTAGFIPSVEIYCAGNATNPTFGWFSVLTTDNGSDAPGVLLSVGAGLQADTDAIYMDATYRWVSTPLGVWLAAGTYWIGAFSSGSYYNHPNLTYGTPSGVSDLYGAPASYLGESGGWPSTTGRDYSIRCPLLT